jgi:UDP-GlcNAc:undecaprenyl-phosphate GlcNAc-1-phosphate transferase
MQVDITQSQFLLLGVSALILTGFLTWPIRSIAIKLGALDVPNLERKTQIAPVPYLGGIAIALGISFVTLSATFVGTEKFVGENGKQITDLLLTILVPAILLCLMGLLDDLRSLSPWPRLVIQTVIGSAVAYAIVDNGTIGTPFSGSGENRASLINTLITIVWIVGICNSINFFDNLDGAASGAVAIAALGVFYIAQDRGQELISALSIVTAGATIGFLMWNKSPAKIYMGDAGALFLGVIISVATLRLNPGLQPTWHSASIPLILLAVPLLDTSVAILSRLGRGISPLTGGKDHLSHRLVRIGLSRKVTAFMLWGASGFCSVFAALVYKLSSSFSDVAIPTFVMLWFLFLLLFLRIPSRDLKTK